MIDKPTLSRAMELATEVAREAGAMLRAEFHREGGPRGTGDHADVDEVVERYIRDRLLAFHTEWSYLGEETGAHGPWDAPARWIVDPNDGTRDYLLGRRGSAVSIALVSEGRPVLGVVYAPLAPDSGGDLFTWYEGGPFLRNEQEIAIRPLTPLLSDHGVILTGMTSRGPAGTAATLAPARFRPSPSIAYRLALVAAGDAEGTYSLHGPSDWDLAGGHALIAARDGRVANEDGIPVVYAAERSYTKLTFAGSDGMVTWLRNRHWDDDDRTGLSDHLSEAYPQAVTLVRKGEAVLHPDRLGRAQGCLLGQLAGDALGSLVEFRPAAAIRSAYPEGVRELEDGGTWNTLAGQPTDDSEMALMLARTLARDGAWTGAAARTAYRAWYDSHPFDIGNTTARGITGHADTASQANGSLMRASPLGVFGFALPLAHTASLARSDSRITHPHSVCADACAAYTIAIATAIRTGNGPTAAHQAAEAWAAEHSAEPSVREALDRSRREPPADYERQMGWVLIALQNAFYQLLHASSFEEGVVATVMAGGDTDTNAAIAGALLGAVHGRDAVPARWRRLVLTCRPITGLSGVHQPRPQPMWPVDAMELAELLLLRGASASRTTRI